MKSVTIAELRDHLSRYLQRVARGESILVRNRQRIVARLEPAGQARRVEGDPDRLADLEARGILRPGQGRINAKLLARRPRVRANVIAALLDEREEGR